jgi:hypothetical protein
MYPGIDVVEGTLCCERAAGSATHVVHSPKMAQYALLEKAQLQQAQKHTAEARETLERLKAIRAIDPLLAKKIQALEKGLK